MQIVDKTNGKVNYSESTQHIRIYFEDKEYTVPHDITVAAAVLGHIHADYTGINAVTGERRGPNCLMGVCFDCLVEINGVPNQQACLTWVRHGMKIKRQMTLVETA